MATSDFDISKSQVNVRMINQPPVPLLQSEAAALLLPSAWCVLIAGAAGRWAWHDTPEPPPPGPRRLPLLAAGPAPLAEPGPLGPPPASEGSGCGRGAVWRGRSARESG